MGQARNRGSREQRMAKAKEKIELMKPSSLKCNNCKSEITDITTLDSKGMRGVDAAFAGVCAACSQTTWAMKGEPEAVAEVMAIIEQDSGEKAKLGFIE